MFDCEFFMNLFWFNQIGQARVPAQGWSPEPAQAPLQVSQWLLGPFTTVSHQNIALKPIKKLWKVKLQGQSPNL